MLPKFSTRKLVQISEEASLPIQAPVLIDNQIYILTQQDVRKLEDYRLLTLHKIMPNGELKPLNSMDIEGLLQHMQQQNLICQQNFCQLLDFVNSKINKPADIQTTPQPMDISTNSCENHTKASITQQLQWENCVNSAVPFPMTYSCGTSTTDINNNKEHCVNKLRPLEICSCCKSKKMYNKSTCTQELFNDFKEFNEPLGAREKLKQKKISNTLA